MASAYALTGRQTTVPSGQVSGALSAGGNMNPAGPSQGGVGGTGKPSGPLTSDQIFLLLMGSTSPADLMEGGATASAFGGASPAIASEAAAHARGPTGIGSWTSKDSKANSAELNPAYYASGLQIATNRHQGPIQSKGRDRADDEVMVVTTNLSGEAKSHALDPKWMSSHGYVAVTRPDANNQTTELQWMLKQTWNENKETMHKANYVAAETWEDKSQTRKLVTDDEIKGKASLGSMTSMTTPTHLMMALYSMPQDEVIRLQHKLWDGGYYQGDSRPTWGAIDDSTNAAYTAAMKDVLTHPDLTLDESIEAASKGTMATRRAGRLAKKAEVDSAMAAETAGQTISADHVRTIADTVATELTGRMLTPEEKEALVGIVQGKDSADVQARASASRKSKLSESGIVDDEELDRFVNLFAVQHAEQFPNVVGALGMRPREFQKWLTDLGLDPNTPFNAANERMVMKELAADYYAQFGNWQDVSMAMLSGPGAGWSDISSGLAPTQGRAGAAGSSSLKTRATGITSSFVAGLPGATVDTTAGAAGGVPTEEFDPQSYLTQELRRRHPTEIATHNLVGVGGLSDSFSAMLDKWGPGPGAGASFG